MLLGKRRDGKRMDTIVLEREKGEREGREGIDYRPTKILYTHIYIHLPRTQYLRLTNLRSSPTS